MKTTNELKKGETVLLSSGLLAQLTTNQKGPIRAVYVHDPKTGIEDYQSVYSTDIVKYLDENGVWQPVEASSKERAKRAQRELEIITG